MTDPSKTPESRAFPVRTGTTLKAAGLVAVAIVTAWTVGLTAAMAFDAGVGILDEFPPMNVLATWPTLLALCIMLGIELRSVAAESRLSWVSTVAVWVASVGIYALLGWDVRIDRDTLALALGAGAPIATFCGILWLLRRTKRSRTFTLVSGSLAALALSWGTTLIIIVTECGIAGNCL